MYMNCKRPKGFLYCHTCEFTVTESTTCKAYLDGYSEMAFQNPI